MNNIIKKINYYIIEVKGKGRCYYKIGEGSLERPKELIKKYNKLRDINASLIYTDTLPYNNEKRLNDKIIHKNLTKLNIVDPFIIKGLLNEDDGANEFFEIPKEHSDLNIVDYAREVVDILKENYSNFKVKNKFINNIKLIYSDKQNHQVCSELIDLMLNNLELNKYINKNILLIGQFLPDWIATFALNNNLCIWHDSKNEKYIYKYNKLNKCILYIDSLEELINMNKDFDLIIANPPYNLGNKITKNIIDNINFNEYVNLMPVSCYKGQELYKYVKSLKLVDPKLFEDAAITNNLNIANLSKNDLGKSFEEIELQTVNPEYREFYKLNSSKINNYNKFMLTNKSDILNSLDPEYDFVVPQKVSNNGVHKTEDCIDYKFNFLNDKNAFKNKNGTFSSVWVNLNYHDKKIKQHLIEFWYKNPLMNKLLFGLNSQYGHINKALPNIDWNIDRDYEHLTYDELLEIMKEELKNNK